ncbi:MAG: hypothetical protein KBH80_02600, partial [Fervidobacterium sp.]|nr:hypothetical protein [Fervidobacterium sp.]
MTSKHERDEVLSSGSGYEKYGSIYLIWLVIFFVIPVIVILAYSFLTRDYQGGIILKFSLQGYKDIFNLNYLTVFIRTV